MRTIKTPESRAIPDAHRFHKRVASVFRLADNHTAGNLKGNAQYNIGGMYEFGLGVTEDYAEAAKWYRKAAEQGDARAQNYLGLIYDIGVVVPQDYAEAHMWYDLAGANGNKDAATLRDVVTEQMTPTQIDKAKKLAREWKPIKK